MCSDNSDNEPGSPTAGKKALRFRRDSYSNASDASSEESLSPAELRMKEAMGALENIALDMRLMQVCCICRRE